MSQKKATRKPAERTMGFSDEERAAMKERARELKAEGRANRGRAEGEKDVLAKIAEMEAGDRAMATRIHALIKAAAPDLAPKTWYGMRAYARDGKVVCCFQSGKKFGSRYCTLAFNDSAALDDGAMWPVGFALEQLTAAEEARITALVEKAVR